MKGQISALNECYYWADSEQCLNADWLLFKQMTLVYHSSAICTDSRASSRVDSDDAGEDGKTPTKCAALCALARRMPAEFPALPPLWAPTAVFLIPRSQLYTVAFKSQLLFCHWEDRPTPAGYDPDGWRTAHSAHIYRDRDTVSWSKWNVGRVRSLGNGVPRAWYGLGCTACTVCTKCAQRTSVHTVSQECTIKMIRRQVCAKCIKMLIQFQVQLSTEWWPPPLRRRHSESDWPYSLADSESLTQAQSQSTGGPGWHSRSDCQCSGSSDLGPAIGADCQPPACVRVSGSDWGARAAAEVSWVASRAQLLILRGFETWGWEIISKRTCSPDGAGRQSVIRTCTKVICERAWAMLWC